MKTILRSPLIVCLLFATTLVSCTNFGKKVKIAGTKGEVFYKNGATESDATKVGEYLKENGFFTNEKGASVQVVKENEEYTVRFVYDKDYYEKTDGIKNLFRLYGYKISKAVFDGKKVNIALANEQFKDFKTIPYNETVAETMENEATGGETAGGEDKPDEKTAGGTFDKSDFDHETRGDITFYWKGISAEASKTIADYIVETGDFNGGKVEIYMIKENDRYILKFPVKEEYRTDPSFINTMAKISKKIKDNVFAGESYSFQMTDEHLTTVKSFDY